MNREALKTALDATAQRKCKSWYVSRVKPEDYTHKIWSVDTFKQAFNERHDAIDTIAAHNEAPNLLTSNQSKIIAAIRAAGTLSDKTTEAILLLIKQNKQCSQPPTTPLLTLSSVTKAQATADPTPAHTN